MAARNFKNAPPLLVIAPDLLKLPLGGGIKESNRRFYLIKIFITIEDLVTICNE